MGAPGSARDPRPPRLSRRFGFEPERVAFALQRLCAPRSGLQRAACAQTVEAPGFNDLVLNHFYRTVAWLAAIRHELEQDLFFQHRDMLSAELDLVFVDARVIRHWGALRADGLS